MQPQLRARRSGGCGTESRQHVICEKPLATTLEDCERIVRMADTKPSLKFMVGQSARFNPICKTIKRMYDEGELGEAFYAEADYLHNIGKRIKDWWVDDRNPHFGLMGGGVHPIDLLRWIVGDIDEVFAISNHKVLAGFPHDDAYLMNFRFENGCMGKMAAFLGCQRPYELNLAIYGTRGTAINDRLFLSKVEELEDFIRLPITILAEHPTFGEEMAHFVDCILNDKAPMIDVRDGAKSAATRPANPFW
ncbi:MAG: Gfo/Idh/MocA family oxidoreductase [Candidatus Latescibacteria bacterium]|nr:Gfo/Idh/MocA family oxidoreductase [Candidatus Latescibacterota bacterium]